MYWHAFHSATLLPALLNRSTQSEVIILCSTTSGREAADKVNFFWCRQTIFENPGVGWQMREEIAVTIASSTSRNTSDCVSGLAYSRSLDSNCMPELSRAQRQRRQDKTTTPVESRNSQEKTTKSLYPVLLEKNKHKKASTALCSAVLTQSGTDAMVPSVPWPVPGHQRLDARQSPLGASQHAKKSSRKNNCGSHTERRLHTEVLHTRIEVVCSIGEACHWSHQVLKRISDFMISIINKHFE